MFCWFIIYIFVVFLIYKLLDRLIRISRIGRYSERYIFVTGCDTGFGHLLAKRLDELGCHVFAGCLTEKGETELKKVSSGRLHTIPLDVTTTESIQKALEYVKSKLPPGKGLWGITNNAGVLSCVGPADWLRIQDYKEQCDVNLWGMIEVTLAFLPLVKKERGRIVNMASTAGRIVYRNIIPYCISKYGVEAFSDGLRRDMRIFGCKVAVIEPGGHRTMIGGRANNLFRKSFDNAGPELQSEYGEDYVKLCDTNIFDPSAAGDPEAVVDVYEHALLGCFPRARYLVGTDAVYMIYPLTLMPEWLSDWIRDKLGKSPAPASLRK